MTILYENYALRRKLLRQSGNLKDRKEVRSRTNETTSTDAIRLWTTQSPEVWQALQEQGSLPVDPAHSVLTEYFEAYHADYDWMREQMARRIPGYQGRYPWWACAHLLDLRYYRWHVGLQGEKLLQLELAVPRMNVVLSGYYEWHSVLNKDYVTHSTDWED